MSSPNGLIFPVVGDTTDTWGVVLSALLTLLDNSDHTTGKGLPITSAALAIDADVSWATHAITAAKAVAFTPVAASAMTSYVNAFYVDTADSNLWWRNSVGTDVQITAAGQLNLAAVGGILGDYSSVSASFSYDDATRRYLAQQELVAGLRPWAGFATGDIDLYQKASSITNKVTLKSPSALAASYSVTWPVALPASQAILQSSSAGVMTASNTIGSNLPIVMQGTGNIQHGNWLVNFQPLLIDGIKTGTNSATQNAGGGVGIPNNAVYIFRLPTFDSSKKIISVTFLTTGATAANSFELGTWNSFLGAIGFLAPVSSTATSVTYTPGSPIQLGFTVTGGLVVAGSPYVRITTDAVSGSTTLKMVQVLYAADQLGNT